MAGRDGFAIVLNDAEAAAEALANCRRVWGGLLIEHLESIAAQHGVPGAGVDSGVDDR